MHSNDELSRSRKSARSNRSNRSNKSNTVIALIQF